MNKTITYILLFVSILILPGSSLESGKSENEKAVFSFIVAADMREFAGEEFNTSQYFRGVCEAILENGKGSFMLSPGDIDPPQEVSDRMSEILGNDYLWFPVVGNHEEETDEDMDWLRNKVKNNLRYPINEGPENGVETTYSFDFMNAHFVVLNQYYDGQSDAATDGDITEALYDWIEKDLEANSKPFLFVAGHEPFISIPDHDNGRMRHKGDNLDKYPENSFRLQKLLREHNVTAFFCGHTHNFSYAKINGIWQVDAGHARGLGDTGAQSTFLKVFVGENSSWVEVYRDDANGGKYSLTRTVELN